MQSKHTIHSLKHHFGWDNLNSPVLNVKSGETIEIDTVDSSGSQLSSDSTVDNVKNLDFSKVNPVTGPIFVENANEESELLLANVREWEKIRRKEI